MRITDVWAALSQQTEDCQGGHQRSSWNRLSIYNCTQTLSMHFKLRLWTRKKIKLSEYCQGFFIWSHSIKVDIKHVENLMVNSHGLRSTRSREANMKISIEAVANLTLESESIGGQNKYHFIWLVYWKIISLGPSLRDLLIHSSVFAPSSMAVANVISGMNKAQVVTITDCTFEVINEFTSCSTKTKLFWFEDQIRLLMIGNCPCTVKISFDFLIFLFIILP